MKVCDLNTGLGRLSLGFAKLRERWEEAHNHWNDEASGQFEKTHLQQIPPRLHLLVGAVQRLAEVVVKAEKDLEDRADEA